MKIFDTRNMPWPSDTPRNFATEPAVWNEFTVRCGTLISSSDDFYFRIEFVTHSAGTAIGSNKNIFSGGNRQGSVDIFQNGDTFFIQSRTSSGSLISLNPTIQNDVHYVTEISFVNGQRVITMNGTTLYSAADTVSGFVLNPTGTYVTTDNVEIYDVTLENRTRGMMVWTYPTWAEDKRLLTFTNVRTDRGVFEAANTSLGWSIKTQLTGTAGTVIERRPSGVYVNSGKFNASTGIYTGLAADQLLTLLAFDYTLTAAEIAQFK